MVAPERFARVDDLFDRALDYPEGERARWLAEACGSDPVLRAEIEKLLKLVDCDDVLVESGAFQGPVWDDVARELESIAELSVSDRVGPFEILGFIGRGGMGAVYRARDRALGRDVALKALNQSISNDASALRRFEREAKLLAGLNHPNIAVLFDFLSIEERGYLVMELVEGETLAERLTRGALGIADSLKIAIQLADALEEAHRKGVVHRDLKPSNVKLTPEGRVKVLDFGLAKAPDLGAGVSHGAVTPEAPTTRSGTVLGTPGYMSPEQVRGLKVDGRSDLWAFGCVLYEMLTGARAFTGGTSSDVIAASLRDEVDWGRLPRDTPPGLLRLLRRCLKRDPRDRLQDAGDARIEIEEIARGEGSEWKASLKAVWPPVIAVLALLLGAGLYWKVGSRPPAPIGSTVRASLVLDPGIRLWQGASSSIAISPDGSRVAFVGEKEERTNLFVRRLEAFHSTPLQGSDGARDPFFSPDGESLGFFAAGEIRRVDLASGSSSTVVRASLPLRGASWGTDGRIVFAREGGEGLFVVPSSGGSAELLLAPDPSEEAVEYLWPQWLPGETRVLFTVIRVDSKGITDQLAVLDLENGRVHDIGRGKQGTFVPSGHIVYAAGGTLEAVELDVDSLTRAEGSARIAESVYGYPTGATAFAASPSGALVYMEPPPAGTIQWIDREGSTSTLESPRGTPGWPRLSPDGRLAALHVGGPETRDVWILDLERPGSMRQLTYRGGGFPVWSRDGRRIAFMSRQGGSGDLYVVPFDGSGAPERVVSSQRTKIPVSWSAEGVLAYYEIAETTERDIWVVDVDSDRIPRPFVATPANELAPVFSPDGRYLAYVSNETGQNEVYVRPFPPPGPVTPISIGGGAEPAWREDGREIFYRQGETLMSVPLRYSPRFEAGEPATAIGESLLPGSGGNASYDVAANGNRFLMLRPPAETSLEQLSLVLNWTALLRGREAR